MRIIMQDVSDTDTRYTAIIKNLGKTTAVKSKQLMFTLLVPQSQKYFILCIAIYKNSLAPNIKKFSSCLSREMVKIHKRQSWFERCGRTLLDNGAGLAMAMLSSKIVQEHVEVEQFSNLWGLLATRPVVSESTYEIINFTVEFFIALIVFTLT